LYSSNYLLPTHYDNQLVSLTVYTLCVDTTSLNYVLTNQSKYDECKHMRDVCFNSEFVANSLDMTAFCTCCYYSVSTV